jgi:hypothetical protein
MPVAKNATKPKVKEIIAVSIIALISGLRE